MNTNTILNEVKFGTDPEVFICINQENPEVISPALLFTEGIAEPLDFSNPKHPVFLDGDYGKWHMDGVAMELTTKSPFATSKVLRNILDEALDALNEYAKKLIFHGEKPFVLVSPSVRIDNNRYDLSNPLIYQGYIFGCDPDNDAFEGKYKCKTISALSHLFRYGGGHWHFSFPTELINMAENVIPAVKFQAATTGLFCMLNSTNPAGEKRRSLTYGKPGRFRTQTYSAEYSGIEYRSPSNSWIVLPEDKLEELIFWCKQGIKFVLEERADLYEKVVERAKNALIAYNLEEANQILKELKNE